jgi:tRNA-modifying protein YgfZ
MTEPLFSAQTRPDRSVIRIDGEGALGFLHNLLTAELLEAKPAYAALLTPQGKILHDVFVVPDGDAVWLDVASVQAADLLKRLVMYRLRAKLEIAEANGKSVAVSSARDLPGVSYADPRHAGMGYRAIVDAGAGTAGDGYDAQRLVLGLGDSVLDIGSGVMFVPEANLDLLNAVSFTKGCYVGQEVVSRTHHRGIARNRMLPVRLEGDAVRGSDIVSGEHRIGEMLSSHGTLGLALINLQRLAESTAPLMCGRAHMHVRKPDWAKYELSVPEAAQ